MIPKLSVLDLIPLRTDQTSVDAVAASRKLARVADEAGFERYWVAEHHMEPFASTHPGVFISMIAADTVRIKVGSGGVLLPNHAPFDVAEQFALLEAAFPGRIDLGLGRAPGGDPAAIAMLRGAAGGDAAARFPEDVQRLALMLRPDGVPVRLGNRSATLTATPKAVSSPRIWMLGTSPSSAQVAAHLGVRYVFGHHFSGTGTAEALDIYRTQFRPSEHLDKPELLVTMNVIVADTEEQARRLVLPSMQTMNVLMTQGRLVPQMLVEEAELMAISQDQRAMLDQIFAHWVVGTRDSVRARIDAFATRHGVDEIMINPGAGTFEGAAPSESPHRETTLRLLSGV